MLGVTETHNCTPSVCVTRLCSTGISVAVPSMPNKLLYLIRGVVTRWEQYLIRGISGESRRSPGFVAAVGRAWRRCSLSYRLPGASSSSHRQRDSTGGRNRSSWGKLFPAQPCCHSPGITKEPLRSCLAGKAEAACLVPGKRAGAGGFQRAA